MFLLTRFDNSKILVNLDNVKLIEATPDTLVVFVNGDSMFVNESLEEIEQRVIDYKVSMLKKVDGTGDTSG